MALWLVPTSRLMPFHLCSSGVRRHQRRRNWDGKRQQQDESTNVRLTITLEDLGRGTKESIEKVGSMGNKWLSSLSMNKLELALIRMHSTRYSVGLYAVCFLMTVVVVVAVTRKYRWHRQTPKTIVRRDRSLGGKEVVVAMGTRAANVHTRMDDPSLSSSQHHQQCHTNGSNVRLPHWWSAVKGSLSTSDEYSQARVNALLRVILDKRLSGKDFEETDVIEIRQACRHSNAKVDFGTENTCDSFFRAALAFLLSACAKCGPNSTFEYAGETMVSFICGLATNINLDPVKASSIVNAAVAARTRAGFLQAWANVVQGNAAEAYQNIEQLVCMHIVFPPEPHSPQMEMVASGLQGRLPAHARKELLNMYTKYVDKHRYIAIEALSLDS